MTFSYSSSVISIHVEWCKLHWSYRKLILSANKRWSTVWCWLLITDNEFWTIKYFVVFVETCTVLLNQVVSRCAQLTLDGHSLGSMGYKLFFNNFLSYIQNVRHFVIISVEDIVTEVKLKKTKAVIVLLF